MEFFTVILYRNQNYAVSIEYQNYSEKDFDQKLEILTKLTKNFRNFEIFDYFLKVRQSLAHQFLAKDCTYLSFLPCINNFMSFFICLIISLDSETSSIIFYSLCEWLTFLFVNSPKARFEVVELPKKWVTDDSSRFDGSSKLPFCTDEKGKT